MNYSGDHVSTRYRRCIWRMIPVIVVDEVTKVLRIFLKLKRTEYGDFSGQLAERFTIKGTGVILTEGFTLTNPIASMVGTTSIGASQLPARSVRNY